MHTYRTLFIELRHDLQSQPGRRAAAAVLGEAVAVCGLFMLLAGLAIVMGGT